MDPLETKKSFKTGELVMCQGEMGDHAYIIEEGRDLPFRPGT